MESNYTRKKKFGGKRQGNCIEEKKKIAVERIRGSMKVRDRCKKKKKGI